MGGEVTYMHHISRGGVNHDGSPSPMYWVFWMVFQNGWTFPGFPGIPGVPELLQVILEGSSTKDIPGCNRMQLEESGHLVGGLGSSRTFGLRQVLAGQSYQGHSSQ